MRQLFGGGVFMLNTKRMNVTSAMQKNSLRITCLSFVSLTSLNAYAQTETNIDFLQRIELQESVLRLQAEELQKQSQAIEGQFQILKAQFEELQLLKEQIADGTNPDAALASKGGPVSGYDSGVRVDQNSEQKTINTIAENSPRPVAPKGFNTETTQGALRPKENGPDEITQSRRSTDSQNTESSDANETARPASERPIDQLLIDTGGILLSPGSLQIEPGFDYSHLSGNNVAINGFSIFDAIVIGTIRVDDLRRDIVTSSLTVRYGIAERLQLEARVPGVYRRDKEILGIGTADIRERTVSDVDLGDIEATLSWQPISNNGLIPATVLKATARFPTGRNPFEIESEVIDRGGESRLVNPPTGGGHYAVSPGANFVWRNDPLVYFGGADYALNLQQEFDEFGVIDPGDSFGWFAGFNFAISDRVSISTSFINRHTKKTRQNGIESIGTATNDARLVFGTAIATPRGRTLLASASIGLTDQSPDFSISFTLPITFRNVGKGIPFIPSGRPSKYF